MPSTVFLPSRTILSDIAKELAIPAQNVKESDLLIHIIKSSTNIPQSSLPVILACVANAANSNSKHLSQALPHFLSLLSTSNLDIDSCIDHHIALLNLINNTEMKKSILIAIINTSKSDQIKFLAILKQLKSDIHAIADAQIYLSIYNTLSATNNKNKELVYYYLLKHISLIKTIPDASNNVKFGNEQDNATVLKFVQESANLPFVLNLDQIIALPAIQALKSSKETLVFYNLLDTLNVKSIPEMSTFYETNKSVLSKIDKDTLFSKMRLFALSNLALENLGKHVDYRTLQSVLDLSDELDLEMLLMDAVQNNMLECKMDQNVYTVLFTKAFPRHFNNETYKMIDTKLNGLQKTFEELLKSIQKLKQDSIGHYTTLDSFRGGDDDVVGH